MTAPATSAAKPRRWRRSGRSVTLCAKPARRSGKRRRNSPTPRPRSKRRSGFSAVKNKMKLARLIYHYLLALGAAVFYRFPARQLFVIGITGTKGKTTTAELVSAILTAAGRRVAVSSTLHFKIGERSERNLKKMTMPGRGFIQKLLRRVGPDVP